MKYPLRFIKGTATPWRYAIVDANNCIIAHVLYTDADAVRWARLMVRVSNLWQGKQGKSRRRP